MPVSSKIAPHDLDLVIAFVNTVNEQIGVDQLSTPAALAAWFEDHGLLQRPAGLMRPRHLAQAIELREALRALMASHNGLPPAPEAARELDDLARRGGLTVSFDLDGCAQLQARHSGFAGSLARILIPVAASNADGSWQRVKACRAQDCRWAFYDSSRNRSGVWCDMAVCGNRTKVRAYRSRSPRD
jgi:predicted RNA-binding Zn ribbon-like protein